MQDLHPLAREGLFGRLMVVSSRFGTIGKGLQNDGINILAQKGTPVRAAQSGIVAYAGNDCVVLEICY